jgi:hypothetical protein
MRIGPIHAALAAKGLAPAEHLVDAGYVSAVHIVSARERHGIDLVGPPRRNTSWQRQAVGAFGVADFAVDWDGRRVRCPEGRTSTRWAEHEGGVAGARGVKVGFAPGDCAACASRRRCTRSARAGRQLSLHPRAEHEALAAARGRGDTPAGRRLYARRQGVEGALSQAVRALGLRRARYRGLAKAGLQAVATAAALDLDRLAAWLAGRPLARTRTSRFAAAAA